MYNIRTHVIYMIMWENALGISLKNSLKRLMNLCDVCVS